jgi:hypothetical protein
MGRYLQLPWVSICAFAGSIILATWFFVWNVTALAGHELPSYLDPERWIGNWAMPLAYLFGAFGLLAVAIRKQIEEGTFAKIGGIAALVTVVFSLFQFATEHRRSVDSETLKLFATLESLQPANTRFCRCGLYKLLTAQDRNPWDQLFIREEVPLKDEVSYFVDKCFSDLKKEERTEHLPDPSKLTKSGASLFAKRGGTIVTLDDDVAFAINSGVVRKKDVSKATMQALLVAKAISLAYKEKMEFEGFANLEELDLRTLGVPTPVGLCDKRGLATFSKSQSR